MLKVRDGLMSFFGGSIDVGRCPRCLYRCILLGILYFIVVIWLDSLGR